jgi:hypothetical protein
MLHATRYAAAMVFVSATLTSCDYGASDAKVDGSEGFERFSTWVQAVAAHVAPSVVQIVVDRYGAERTPGLRASNGESAHRMIGSGSS